MDYYLSTKMQKLIAEQRDKWKSWYITLTSYSITSHLSDAAYRKRCKEAEKLYKQNMDILSRIEAELKFYKEV